MIYLPNVFILISSSPPKPDGRMQLQMYGKTKKRPNKTMKNCPYPLDMPSARTHRPTPSPFSHCFKKNCHFATFSHNHFCISIFRVANSRWKIRHLPPQKMGRKSPCKTVQNRKEDLNKKFKAPEPFVQRL